MSRHGRTGIPHVLSHTTGGPVRLSVFPVRLTENSVGRTGFPGRPAVPTAPLDKTRHTRKAATPPTTGTKNPPPGPCAPPGDFLSRFLGSLLHPPRRPPSEQAARKAADIVTCLSLTYQKEIFLVLIVLSRPLITPFHRSHHILTIVYLTEIYQFSVARNHFHQLRFRGSTS